MALQKSQCNEKFLSKIMSSSYHMEQKTFIEESCTNNMHINENVFCWFFFGGLGVLFFQRDKNIVVYFGIYESPLHF